VLRTSVTPEAASEVLYCLLKLKGGANFEGECFGMKEEQ
jgi:hypothetical protein